MLKKNTSSVNAVYHSFNISKDPSYIHRFSPQRINNDRRCLKTMRGISVQKNVSYVDMLVLKKLAFYAFYDFK